MSAEPMTCGASVFPTGDNQIGRCVLALDHDGACVALEGGGCSDPECQLDHYGIGGRHPPPGCTHSVQDWFLSETDNRTALRCQECERIAKPRACALSLTPRMDEIHEAGIRRALRAWLSVQTERPTEEDRLTMLEQMRARAFAIFGAADERAEAADRQAAAMEAKWRRGE